MDIYKHVYRTTFSTVNILYYKHLQFLYRDEMSPNLNAVCLCFLNLPLFVNRDMEVKLVT